MSDIKLAQATPWESSRQYHYSYFFSVKESVFGMMENSGFLDPNYGCKSSIKKAQEYWNNGIRRQPPQHSTIPSFHNLYIDVKGER